MCIKFTFGEGLAEVNEDDVSPRGGIQGVVGHIQPHHVLHVELDHLRAGGGVDAPQQQPASVL